MHLRYSVDMTTDMIETKKTVILAWGTLLVTLLVTDRIGTDPVNVGKMLLLATVGFSLIPFISIPNTKSLFRENSWLLALSVLVIAMFISVILSENTFERGLYGGFGRNTGFLSFLSLAIFFIIAAQLKSRNSYKKIYSAFLFAGIFNLFYCLIANAGYDIFTWSNPYNAVLGTFGNPNFIGSFMGIFSSVLFIRIISIKQRPKVTLAFFILWLLSFVVIYLADALQGILVAAFGVTFSFFLYLRSRYSNSRWPKIYFSTLIISAFVAILGIFQKGPLSSLLYKPSVSFRGSYWKAGLSMGQSDPFFGVGIDSYGLYYRTFRSIQSTISPGLETTTDAAHNVYIDVFAGSGAFALIAYIFLNAFVLVQSLKFIKKNQKFDSIFVTLFIAWAGYQLQSFISINQLGLAIWGWTLGGALIGYTRLNPELELSDSFNSVKEVAKGKKKKKKNESELLPPSTLMKVISASIIGFLFALPPFIADAKLRQYLAGKGSVEGLYKLAESWPRDSIRLNKSIVILAQSNRLEDAKLLAAFGTTVFPNDFASWSALYELSPEGSEEKAAYKNRLHEIDPFNPKYFEK